ncbi:MAG: cytochrome c biogenesis protein ResB [Thermodesulfobacteriota bacterium]
MAEDLKRENTRVDFVDKIWGVFTSLKLVITLLLVLSVLSVIGTVIEQNKPLQEYYRFFRPETVDLFGRLGLLDMYHSWWFTACLALLALNIIACTMERYPLIMRGMKKQGFVLDEKIEAGLTNVVTLKYHLEAETVESRVTAIAGKNLSARPVVTEAENARHFFYEKGKYTRLAFFLTHLSVLVIFIGAIAGSLFGFKGYVNINEGELISSVQARQGENKGLNFSVKCNSFNVDFYPNGAPKDYRSDLSVIRDGKEVARKTIRVNDPLSYEGITFYQSSYGKLPDEVTLEIKDKDGLSLGTVAAPFGRKVDIPGGAQIELLDFRDDFHLSDGSEAGPVVGVNLYSPGAAPNGIWISETRPEMNRYGAYSFAVKGVKLRKYTGLQVNKDPGVWVVWTGCIMLVAGIMMAFFMSHKKFWIRIGKDKKGRVEVTAGGTANKNKHAFASEVERMVESFREVSS